MSPAIPAFLVELEDRFNAAMISNDVAQIEACVAEDWVLVTPERGPVSRESILGVIRSGLLTHATMTKVAARATVYDDIAIITGRGQNTGTFAGQPIAADEWITDVYRRTELGWKCVLTHLTPAGKP